MSLKGFHLLFVSVSTILAVGFGAWAVREYLARGDTAALAIGIGSFAAAVVLLIYGKWFLEKLKGVRSL